MDTSGAVAFAFTMWDWPSRRAKRALGIEAATISQPLFIHCGLFAPTMTSVGGCTEEQSSFGDVVPCW